VIWIDVHPARETWYTWHVCFPRQSTYALRTLDVGSPCMWQPFTSHQQRRMDPTAPEKKGSWHDPQLDWVVHRSATQFLSQHSHQSSNESQTSIDNMLHWFTGPINTSMRSVRSILAHGANSSVLNRHRLGLQPWRCRLATYHSPTFPTDGLHFTPKGPAWSLV
jgi:hypothetical protein